MLEHFGSIGGRIKIVLCLFYDISDLDDLDFNADGTGLNPSMKPSLAPTFVAMDKIVAAND